MASARRCALKPSLSASPSTAAIPQHRRSARPLARAPIFLDAPAEGRCSHFHLRNVARREVAPWAAALGSGMLDHICRR